jgi:aryl-alcohol dehydrogenase-like predicted oxidoreductase
VSAIDKIVLGTAQLGLDYGINNTLGKPTKELVDEILLYAFNVGIRELDTAEAYGDSQKVIGDFLKNHPQSTFSITTKMHLKGSSISNNIYKDLEELNVPFLDGYMFHNYKDYIQNPSLVELLLDFKKNGLIKRLGVSLYTNEEAINTLINSEVDFIQIPFNILDNLNNRIEVLELANSRGIQVYVRSVFLQGLFFLDKSKYTNKLKPAIKYIDKIYQIANNYNLSIQELCLGYVLTNKYVSKVVIGVESLSQLKNNFEIINNINIPEEVIELINDIKVKETEILNPAFW